MQNFSIFPLFRRAPVRFLENSCGLRCWLCGLRCGLRFLSGPFGGLRLGLCRLLVGSCGPLPRWVNCWAVAVLRGKFQYLRSAPLWAPCRAPLGFRVVCGLRCSLWAPMGSNMSCFMNMINYYLLKGQSEFLHVKQKQPPCLSKFLCVRFGSRLVK